MVLALFRPRTASDRPQAVVALNDAVFAENLAAQLRTAGWQVHIADTAAAARRLCGRHNAGIAVLSIDLPDETGYLACTKLQKLRNKPRVVLVADELSDGKREFAAYVGASDCLPATIGARGIAARVTALAPAVA